jgi:hypothetical protein
MRMRDDEKFETIWLKREQGRVYGISTSLQSQSNKCCSSSQTATSDAMIPLRRSKRWKKRRRSKRWKRRRRKEKI